MPRSFLAALLTFIGVLALAPMLTRPAAAAEPAALSCNDSAMLNRVKNNFRYAVAHVPNLPQVDIVGFEHARENPYPGVVNTWGGSMVSRQYCRATALLSNGHKRSVWYLIEAGMGFASLGNNVESCVAGFDRWHVYDGYCRVLR
jgi:hypothetical protein